MGTVMAETFGQGWAVSGQGFMKVDEIETEQQAEESMEQKNEDELEGIARVEFVYRYKDKILEKSLEKSDTSSCSKK